MEIHFGHLPLWRIIKAGPKTMPLSSGTVLVDVHAKPTGKEESL
jgi:hypothetical protein